MPQWTTSIAARWTDLARHLRVMRLQDPPLAWASLTSFGLLAIMFIALAVMIRPTTEQVILHYSVYFGIDLIDAWYAVYLVPAIGTFIFLLNSALAIGWYQRERVISFLLIGATTFLEIILTIAVTLMIWINQ